MKIRARLGSVLTPKLLSVFLLLLLPPAGLQAQFTFTTNYDGSLNISQYTGSSGAVTIPDTTNGMAITSIGYDAFGGTSVTNVIVPNSITSMADLAFYYCTSLQSVTIGNGLTYLPFMAFNDCSNLTSVNIPTNVTDIGYEAFFRCSSLAGVTIPDSVTVIESYAFSDCSDLTNIMIPAGVIEIEDGAFEGCTSMTAIAVDTNNPTYISLAGVLFNHNQTTLIACPGGKAGSYTVPNSVTYIDNDAFSSCTSLTSVTIPKSVTGIGPGAFYDCTSLSSITIPNSVVTSIWADMFANCTSLTNATIGNGVTSIGDEAFYNCTNLTSITIPNSVTSIGQDAFFNCHGLTSVTIPDSVTGIGLGAFLGCFNLTWVYFQGNPPGPFIDQGPVMSPIPVFPYDTTLYYLPGTTGWGTTFGGAPTALWNPQMQAAVQMNQIGFNLTGPTNAVILVEACTNLANPTWVRLGTNTLNGGSSYFSDPRWTNYPGRFYRLRSP
jgi:hypothetical protein